MQVWSRYAALFVAILISLHVLLQLTYRGYKDSTSLSAINERLKFGPWLSDSGKEEEDTSGPANATFVILARNRDMLPTIASMENIEKRFNHRYNYPYVFLNEVPFHDEFKARILNNTKAKVEFGLIPKEHWYQPDWINADKAKDARKKMFKEHVIYGGSQAYRNMCRFNSGFFFKHELLQKYRWYWRIEPNVRFHCDINFDPFVYMRDNKKTYSFTISLYEYENTIRTLWGHVRDFMELKPQYIAKDNALDFISNDGGKTYNLCHFWSNFEIADMDFWRGEAYTAFFDYLDSQGGFYYERWGDAPVHSIAAALFLPKEKIHFFSEIGYTHNPFTHCPWDKGLREELNCSNCPEVSFDYSGYSCLNTWHRTLGEPTRAN